MRSSDWSSDVCSSDRETAQLDQLIIIFYALGNGDDVHAMRDVDHAMHDCEVRAVGAVETRDERSVDLEHFARKLLQVCQGSITRPEVVKRNLYAIGHTFPPGPLNFAIQDHDKPAIQNFPPQNP